MISRGYKDDDDPIREELLNPVAAVRAIGDKMKNPLDIINEEKMIQLAAEKVQVIDGGAVVSFERKG